MWVAHGSSECDKNGDDRAKYQIYAGDDEAGIIAAAESLNNSLKNVSGFVEIPNGKLSFFPEDESLGVTYYLTYQGILANKYAISVGSGTLMQILSNTKFPNTVFVFGACHGIVDDIFNQFLIDHGAAAVIGYEKNSANNIADKICKELLSCASTQRSALGDHAFSLKSSLIKANSKIWSLYSDEVSLNASIYMKKDFYYWGRGDLTGKIVKNSFGVNKPVESATINAYRYYNDKMVLCKTVTTDADGKFSFENENKMNWGYYLMQVVKGYAEAFFKLDFTADNADLGEIVIGQEDAPLEMDDVYWYVWTYYPLYSTTIGTPDEINDWANKLRNRKVTVASMMRYFYELSEAEDIGGDGRSYAIMDYTALVGRSPSDYERANLESKALSGMSREDIIKYILSTGDFQTRCYELGIVGGMW